MSKTQFKSHKILSRTKMEKVFRMVITKPHLLLIFLINSAPLIVAAGFVYNGSQMELNRGAKILPNSLLRLTNTTQFAVGHAFYTQPQRFKLSSTGKAQSFSTTFVFAIVPDKSAAVGHGMAFVISPTKDLAGGGSGQFLGILNETSTFKPSNHIVAVELDTLSIDQLTGSTYYNGHMGIDANSLKSIKLAAAGYFEDEKKGGQFKKVNLVSGDPMQVWVEYDGEKCQMNLTLGLIHRSKPKKPLLSVDFDISPFILENMYVGFSASTGREVSSHYVLRWSFELGGEEALELDLSKLPSLPDVQQVISKVMVMAIGIFLGAVVVSITLLCLWSGRGEGEFMEILEDWEVQCGIHRFPYEELVVATKGFSDRELLGKGGFGKVHRGVLPLTNIEVAVKRISHDSKQGLKEFMAEIETIGQVRHRNLVRVLGYCRGKGELILVYEYMPNASLDKFLYNNPNVTLSWDQRYRIINDVALALNYLHNEWIEAIVHRDIKASNVLLDDELNGKLGDFGLARCSKHAQDPQTTNVAGTLGYIAPELARSGKATTKTDVYAFGAFCLEVVCGRRPVVQGASPREMVLVDWVYDCWTEGRMLSTVDPKLNEDINANEVELVLKLGLLCTNYVADARPKVSQVVMYLRGDALLPDDLKGHFQIEKSAGHSKFRTSEHHSTPLLTITESLASVGR